MGFLHSPPAIFLVVKGIGLYCASQPKVGHCPGGGGQCQYHPHFGMLLPSSCPVLTSPGPEKPYRWPLVTLQSVAPWWFQGAGAQCQCCWVQCGQQSPRRCHKCTLRVPQMHVTFVALLTGDTEELPGKGVIGSGPQ